MRLKKNVTLGIGLIPNFRLHIAAGSGSAPTGAFKALYAPVGADGSGSASTTWNFLESSSFNSVCARFNSSIRVNDTIISSSDIRIKKNIEDINDDLALQNILDIQPKTYNYIDVVNKGDKWFNRLTRYYQRQ